VARARRAVNAKRAGLCQLRDLLITTPEPLRSQLRPLTRARLLQRLAATRPSGGRDPELRGSMLALRSIARRVLQLIAEERELAREIETLTRRLPPQLLEQPGVGPHAAAQLILSWSHQGRNTSEAAFARLAGAAPIPASSGQTIRYRLDRSGARKLNRALHMLRSHPPTIAYIERRTQEGNDLASTLSCETTNWTVGPGTTFFELAAVAGLVGIVVGLCASVHRPRRVAIATVLYNLGLLFGGLVLLAMEWRHQPACLF